MGHEGVKGGHEEDDFHLGPEKRKIPPDSRWENGEDGADGESRLIIVQCHSLNYSF